MERSSFQKKQILAERIEYKQVKIKARQHEFKLELALEKLEINKQIHQEEGCMELPAEAQVDNQFIVAYQWPKLQEDRPSPPQSRSPPLFYIPCCEPPARYFTLPALKLSHINDVEC